MSRAFNRTTGLQKTPSSLLGADALRVAENAWVDGEGAIRVRPAFGNGTEKAGTYYPKRIWLPTFGTASPTAIVLSYDSVFGWRLETTSGTITGNATPFDSSWNVADAAEARGSFYVTTNTGVRKLTSAADTATEAVGWIEPSSGTYAAVASGRAVSTGTNVAYRVCFTKTDANNYVVRSAPSPWMQATNALGGTANMTLVVPFASDVAAGHVIEVYRSKETAGTPTDELFLAMTYTVTAGDVTAGYATITDATAEGSLGRACYSNPSREGVLATNGRPPLAVHLASFGGCLWYGHTKPTQTLIMKLVRALDASVSGTLTDAFGYASIAACATTIGLNTITVPAASTTLHVGMYVWDSATNPEAAGTHINANTTITNISGTTVTLSAVALATNASVTLKFSDRLTINSVHFYPIGNNPGVIADRTFTCTSTATQTARELAFIVTAQSGVGVVAAGIEDPYGLDSGSVILRREDMSGAAFSVAHTAPTGVITFGENSATSAADKTENVAWFSKPDEPEAVTPVSFVAFGSGSNAITRMVATESALLVFTLEGLYRLTGSAPDQWSVDLLDADITLARGEMAAFSGGSVFAYTNRGLVEITGGGVGSVLSGPIRKDLEVYDVIYTAPSSYPYGNFVVVLSTLGIVLLGLGDGTQCTDLWCLSMTTGVWSHWDLGCVALASYGATTYAAQNGLYWRLRPLLLTQGYDRTFGSLSWTHTGATVTITDAATGEWDPEVGDWISAFDAGLNNTQYRRITAASLAGGSWTLTLDEALGSGYTGSRTAYEGIPLELEWHAERATPAGLCRELQPWIELDSLTSAELTAVDDVRMLVGGRTEYQGTAQTAVVTASRARVTSREVRCGTPRAVGRAQQFRAYLWLSEILWSQMRVLGMLVVSESTSERGVRR